jgi:hypothetical protein
MKLTANFKRTTISRVNDFYSISDSYQLYKQLDYKKKVKKKVFNEVMRDFTEFMANELLESGALFFPENTGFLRIQGSRDIPELDTENKTVKVKAAINWAATNELWKDDEQAKQNKTLIHHLNEGTDYVRYGIKWIKPHYDLMMFEDTFVFIPCRHLKRKTAEYIQKGKEYKVIIKQKT